MIPEVQLWCDGSGTTRGNPGGWGTVLVFGAVRRELCGASTDATNNMMELTAAIKGFQALKTTCRVHVYSDSEYVVNCFRQSWYVGWRRKKWRGVKNVELWQELIRLAEQHDVTWHWVRGHSKVELNERCDRLAGGCRLALKAALEAGTPVASLNFPVEGLLVEQLTLT
jgi:ribonuclease HI